MPTMTKAALAGLATSFCVQSASAEQIDVGLLLPFGLRHVLRLWVLRRPCGVRRIHGAGFVTGLGPKVASRIDKHAALVCRLGTRPFPGRSAPD